MSRLAGRLELYKDRFPLDGWLSHHSDPLGVAALYPSSRTLVAEVRSAYSRLRLVPVSRATLPQSHKSPLFIFIIHGARRVDLVCTRVPHRQLTQTGHNQNTPQPTP